MHLSRANTRIPQPVNHDASILKEVLADRGLHAGMPQAATTLLPPGETIERHAHPTMTECFYVLAGEVRFEVEGATILLGVGDFIGIQPGETHALANPAAHPAKILYWGLLPHENALHVESR